jgi:lysylphosphatidylglycerol synthetase-like protein (DUF2156 family)
LSDQTNQEPEIQEPMNQLPAGLQFVVIMQIGFGLCLAFGPFLLPVYVGLQVWVVPVILICLVLGLGVARSALLISKKAKVWQWYVSSFVFTLAVLVLLQYIVRHSFNLDALIYEMNEMDAPRPLARYFFNIGVFIVVTSVWVQLFRPKVRSCFKK